MFSIYKRGQGKWGRYVAAGSAAALVIYGCYSLYEYLSGTGLRDILLFEVPGVEMDINLPFLAAFSVFAGLLIAGYLVLNKPGIGDFLIDTELEMKKVSWPGRSEIIGSSAIVVITVVVLALVVLVFDFVVQVIVRFIYGIG